jgi:PAS domain S-box-containing protein
MDPKDKFPSDWKAGVAGSAIVFAVGFLLLAFPSRLSQTLTHASYNRSFDLSSFARPDLSGSDVVIIYMDEDSYRDLKQPLNLPWDRALHAQLLNRLKADGAKAVVMDIVFSDPGLDPAADQKFAEAIRSNGRVILAADYEVKAEETLQTSVQAANQANLTVALTGSLTTPYAPLEAAAAGVGLDKLLPDEDFVIRRHSHGLRDTILPPSLSWETAQFLGLKLTKDPEQRWLERWVYYYGPQASIPYVSYEKTMLPGGVQPGFFRNKIVFIGARPMVGAYREKRDELRSPYTSSSGEFLFMPMVEVHATQFLNLLRGDWLRRPSPAAEMAIIALTSIIFGFGFLRFRPLVATGMAVIAALVVVLATQSLFSFQHVWFAWMIIVAAQIPCALLYAIVYRSLEWYTQRRRLEEERRRADARIREQAALLDKAQDAILVHDLDWRAQYWNPSAERLYGWTFDEVKEKNLRTEVFKADECKLLDVLQEALRNGEWAGELKQQNREGKMLTVSSRWTLVRDDEGRPRSVLVINTDMTERKKLEAQFLRTQRMESIGTLAGGIAHDLNNVLSPILMGVELLKMKSPDEYSVKMLNTMASSAKRGSDMVKQVLAFARGHGGEKSVLQIGHLLKEMQKIVKETFPKTIEFKTEVEDIAPILGDATQIHQIILNLCVNARDAMPEGGSIVMTARNVTLTGEEAGRMAGARPIAYVLLSVTDTGTGIPPEIIDKIFEPFFTTKEVGKGTGLGLSTVISIIKSHDGFLDLKSEVGKGTTFNVYLPAAQASAPPPVAAVALQELWGKGETVMLVDDEPAVLELTKSILVHYGYKVVTAIHGADALALYGQYKEKIKVVLMDMLMPVMDGPSTIRALKAQQPGLQFIAISGLMQPEKLKEQLDGDEISFIAKPCAPENLLLALRKAIVTGAV